MADAQRAETFSNLAGEVACGVTERYTPEFADYLFSTIRNLVKAGELVITPEMTGHVELMLRYFAVQCRQKAK